MAAPKDMTATHAGRRAAAARRRYAKMAEEMRAAGWMAVAPESVMGFVAAHRTAPDQIPGGLLDALYGAYEHGDTTKDTGVDAAPTETRRLTLSDVVSNEIHPALAGRGLNWIDYDLRGIASEAFELVVDQDEDGNDLETGQRWERQVDDAEFWIIVDKHRY